MWMGYFLTVYPHSSWYPALKWVWSSFNSGTMVLVTNKGTDNSELCVLAYLLAWHKLQPQWSRDILDWTPQEALCFPVPLMTSARWTTGLQLVDLVTWNISTSEVSLHSPDDVASNFRAPGQVHTALAALRDGSTAVLAPVLTLALSASSTRYYGNPSTSL